MRVSPMVPRMFRDAHDLKILRMVVQPVTVFVVDNFIAPQLATKGALHDNSMLRNPDAFYGEPLVTLGEKAGTGRSLAPRSCSSRSTMISKSLVMHVTQISCARLPGTAPHRTFVTVILKGCGSGITIPSPAHVVGSAPPTPPTLSCASWDRADFHSSMIAEKT